MYGRDTLSYMHTGDPVMDTGDLDFDPADRRMMGTCGPLTLMPGDSQYVLIKMAIGRGADRLESITLMKEIMDTPEPQVPTLKTATDPHPISVMMLNALDPIQASVIFGYDADGSQGPEINFATLTTTDLPPIDSMIIEPSYPGFNGEVARMFFGLSDLLTQYLVLYDSTVHTFTIAGEYSNGAPLLLETSLTIHGHQSGDLNLDGIVDISDLIYMVEYFFTGGPAPQIMETADLDYNGTVDISDMLVLIEHMFGQ